MPKIEVPLTAKRLSYMLTSAICHKSNLYIECFEESWAPSDGRMLVEKSRNGSLYCRPKGPFKTKRPVVLGRVKKVLERNSDGTGPWGIVWECSHLGPTLTRGVKHIGILH